MLILRVEHKVPNFDGWKKAFESDPIDRKKSGMLGYSIFQPVDDPNYVIIDLTFQNLEDAENTLAALQNLWKKVEGTVMMNPQTRILNLMETREV